LPATRESHFVVRRLRSTDGMAQGGRRRVRGEPSAATDGDQLDGGGLDNGAFDRLGRYNTALWKQTVKTLLLLHSIRIDA
jgi:hypothetical protein